MRSELFKEVFVMAMDSIRSNKLRSSLTILGIVIGVLTIVSMVAVIEGINASFTKQMESLGSTVMFVTRFDPGFHGRLTEEMRKRKKLTLEDSDAIEQKCPSVAYTSPEAYYFRYPTPKVKHLDKEIDNPRIIGVNHKYLQIHDGVNLETGRFYTEGENNNKAEVCVIGSELADSLFPNMNPIGKVLEIDNRTFTVIGTFVKQGKFLGQSQDNVLVIPVQTFFKYYSGFTDISITARAKSAELLDAARDEVINIMRIRRKVKITENNNFAVFGQETISNLWNQLTGAAFLVMIVISSIGLLVGGIGVMNIMLVSVKERTREIGLRKALGAKRNEIRNQFLYEAMILTMTGGLLGIAAGVLISGLIRLASGIPSSINLASVVAALVVSTSVGLFFGIYPASQAAKLNPVDSLRYE